MNATMLDRVVPIRIAFRSFGVRKQVGARQVTEEDTEATLRAAVETGVATEADAEMVNASKRTLDCEELRAIARVDGEIRAMIERYSVPGGDVLGGEGVHFIPHGLVVKVEGLLEAFKAKREAAVEAFIAAYPAAVEAARARLNGLFDPRNYPPVDGPRGVRSTFSFGWRYLDLGAPRNLATISEALFAVAQEEAMEHWAAAAADVEAALRTSFAELVSHLAAQLGPPDGGRRKILHESALAKFREFLDLFAHKNLTDDRALDTLVTEAKSLVDGVSAAALRKDESFRDAIRVGFADLEARVKPLLVAKPTRSIVFAPENDAAGSEAHA